MATKTKSQNLEAQNPLILRAHRLMEAFAKSDDERDFYLDRMEGFVLYADLDKTTEELKTLETEIAKNPERYSLLPKLTFYETKKIMEGFVNEKVYDIDVKEKLLDIIDSKEARENFLEFIYDHHSELEKWQQFYQERSRIRIIEWLRNNQFLFVFEEDLNMPPTQIEKLKKSLFDKKVAKELEAARKILISKAKSYYTNEALNPRPKRGRPPKQAQKVEVEAQLSNDVYTAVPVSVRPFLFTPDISNASDITFSSKFETVEQIMSHRKIPSPLEKIEDDSASFNQKLTALRTLSNHWMEAEKVRSPEKASSKEKLIPALEKAAVKPTKAKEVSKPAAEPKKKAAAIQPAKPVKQSVQKRLLPVTPKPKKAKKVASPNAKRPAKRLLRRTRPLTKTKGSTKSKGR